MSRAHVPAFQRRDSTSERVLFAALAVAAHLCVQWVAAPVRAQSPAETLHQDLPHEAVGIGFAATVEVAREHPLMRALAAEGETYRAAEKAVDGLSSNPTVMLSPGYRFAPTTDRGFEGQLTFNQQVHLGDVAGSRRGTAQAAAARAGAESIQQAMARAQEAAGLWLALWERREMLSLLSESKRLADSFVASTRRAAEVGQLTRADVAHAEVFLGELAVEQLRVAGEAHEYGLALSLQLGRSTDAPMVAEGEVPDASLPELAELLSRTRDLEQTPVVQLAQAAAALARAQAGQVRAENSSQIGLGFYIQNESPRGFMGYLNATFQLPFFDQGTLDRAAADAQVSRAEVELLLAQRQATYQLSLLAHEVTHQRQAEAAVREQLTPPLVAQRVAIERLYEVGEGSVLELLRARQAELGGQRALVTARAARMHAEQRLSILLDSYGLAQPRREETP